MARNRVFERVDQRLPRRYLMHVERLQGIWSSDKGLKKMHEAAAMLQFANKAKDNARNTSKQGAIV